MKETQMSLPPLKDIEPIVAKIFGDIITFFSCGKVVGKLGLSWGSLTRSIEEPRIKKFSKRLFKKIKNVVQEEQLAVAIEGVEIAAPEAQQLANFAEAVEAAGEVGVEVGAIQAGLIEEAAIVWAAATKTEALQSIGKLPLPIQATIKDAIKKGSHAYLDFIVKELPDGNYIFQVTKPGNVPGSKAIYYKKISFGGDTMEFFKDTFDPVGNLIHRKGKYHA